MRIGETKTPVLQLMIDSSKSKKESTQDISTDHRMESKARTKIVLRLS